MGTTYVALDLETTGLDLEADEIIEVGAVRFDAEGVIDTFQTLVNPGRPIAPAVVTLTGITDDAVRTAPPVWSVAPKLEEFLGRSPLVGHNVLGFDTLFLQRAGVLHSESVYDTQRLAEMLLPGLAEYGLAALCERFGIALTSHHRADADAEASRLLFLRLREICAGLPAQTLSQTVQWLSLTACPYRTFFREVAENGVRPVSPLGSNGPSERAPDPVALRTKSPLTPVAPGGGRRCPAIGERAPGSVAGFRPSRRAGNDGGRCGRGVRAGRKANRGGGNGYGKVAGVPDSGGVSGGGERGPGGGVDGDDQPPGAVAEEGYSGGGGVAWEAKERRNWKQGRSGSLKACQLKGRRNYLCLSRFNSLRTAGVVSDEEALLATRILIWLAQTETGDRAELRLSQGEEAVWRRLSADGADCTSSNSPYVVDGSCFLQKARKTAEASHIVVVNHALLLSDKARGGRVLPAYEHLIVDEAHHLEDEATRQFGFASGERAISELLDRCDALSGPVQAGLTYAGIGARHHTRS